MTIKEQIAQLNEKAANLFKDARTLAADWKGKEMPADVTEQRDRLIEEITSAKEKIQSLQAEERKEASLNDLESFFSRPVESQRLPVGAVAAGMLEEKGEKEMEQKIWSAFNVALAKGPSKISEAQYKDLQGNIDPQGGYLIPPQQFVDNLIRFVNNLVFIRGLATVYTVQQAVSLGAPSLDADPADDDWTGEVTAVSNDTTFAFGKRELRPHDLSKLVKVSKKLILQAVIDPAQLVAERLAYKYAVTQEKAFMTGTGNDQPLGVFTASNMGISTGRDYTMANASSITKNDLIGTKMQLKSQYQGDPSLRWILHRNIFSAILQLQTSQGYPIFGDLENDAPNAILGVPYLLSEYAPSALSTGQYAAILGVFRHYWIADAIQFQVQVLVEKYADTNQNGYIARGATDGMPVLEEAFVRAKFA